MNRTEYLLYLQLNQELFFILKNKCELILKSTPELIVGYNPKSKYNLLNEIIENDFHIKNFEVEPDYIDVYYVTCKYSGDYEIVRYPKNLIIKDSN